jgi:hypothetical protein
MELVRGRGRQWVLDLEGTVTTPLGELPLEVSTPITGEATPPP